VTELDAANGTTRMAQEVQRLYRESSFAETGVLAMGGHRLLPLASGVMPWLELAIATPVVLWAGWPFFVRCVESIRNRPLQIWAYKELLRDRLALTRRGR